jgi:signal peptidase I
LAKRCMGLSGERVEVREHLVWIDGLALREDAYIQLPEEGGTSLRQNAGPLRVPAGHYFFLGDNRAFSRDSRAWGTAPRNLLRGRIVLVLWSTAFAGDQSQVHSSNNQTPRPLDALRSLLLARRDRWLRPVR